MCFGGVWGGAVYVRVSTYPWTKPSTRQFCHAKCSDQWAEETHGRSCLSRRCAALTSEGPPAGLIAVLSARCARPGMHIQGPSAPETYRSWQCPLVSPQLSSACAGNTTGTPLHMQSTCPCHFRSLESMTLRSLVCCTLTISVLSSTVGGTAGGPLSKHITTISWVCHNWVPFCWQLPSHLPHWLTGAVVGSVQKWQTLPRECSCLRTWLCHWWSSAHWYMKQKTYRSQESALQHSSINLPLLWLNVSHFHLHLLVCQEPGYPLQEEARQTEGGHLIEKDGVVDPVEGLTQVQQQDSHHVPSWIKGLQTAVDHVKSVHCWPLFDGLILAAVNVVSSSLYDPLTHKPLWALDSTGIRDGPQVYAFPTRKCRPCVGLLLLKAFNSNFDMPQAWDSSVKWQSSIFLVISPFLTSFLYFMPNTDCIVTECQTNNN